MQKKGLISILIIFMRCYIGHSLECYSCFDECQDKNTKTCGPGAQCILIETQLGEGRTSLQRDCLNSQDCHVHPADSSKLHWCCNTDRCNMALPRTTPKSTTSNVTTTPGAPLKCIKCDTPCVIWTETTCKPEEVCATNSAQFAGITFNKRGCANTTICSTVSTENIAGTNMAVKHECCHTNLCNSGNRLSAIHRGLPAVAVPAAMLAMWIAKRP